MSALTVSDLRKVEGEPRVHDIRLGELLGFAKPVSVRRITSLGRFWLQLDLVGAVH